MERSGVMLNEKNLEALLKVKKSLPQEKKRSKSASTRKYLAYDFINITPEKPIYSNNERGDLTGTLEVQLEAITPLVAVEEFKGQKPNVKKIPASSLRGMIRTAAEIMWNEAITVIDRGGLHSEEEEVIPPAWYLSNDTTLDHHRLASHLFGFVVTEERTSSKPMAMASVLKFSDAVSENVQSQEVHLKPNTLSAPQGIKNEEEQILNPAYLAKNKNVAAGRKIYLAGRIASIQKNCLAKNVKIPLNEFVGLSPQIDEIIAKEKHDKEGKDLWQHLQLIFPKTKYMFTIQFNQLKQEQLAALVRVLELTNAATHAVGRGKPLGFGRVKLNVTNIHVQQKESFFDLSQKSASKSLNKQKLFDDIDPYLQQLRIFEKYATIANFDGNKMYLPPGNAKLSDKNPKKVLQYSKHKG